MNAPRETPPAWLGTLTGLLDRSRVLVALYDPDDRLVYANAGFREEFGLQVDERPSWTDILRQAHAAGRGTRVQTDDFERWLVGARSRRGKAPFRAFETDMRSGRWLWMTETVNEEGWMLSIAPDISSLQQVDARTVRLARDRAERLARTDDLTGTANRRGILAALEELVAQPPDRRSPFSICLIDLDRFKAINDTHGHDIGDQVLQHFAREVLQQVRGQDWFGRYGGEEFLLLLPRTDPAGARQIVDRLRAALPPLLLPEAAGSLAYSFSAGISGGVGGEFAKDLLKRADAALYQAKRDGRACSRIDDALDGPLDAPPGAHPDAQQDAHPDGPPIGAPADAADAPG